MISGCFVGGFLTESPLVQFKNKSEPFPSKGALTVVHKFVDVNRNQACLGKEKP